MLRVVNAIYFVFLSLWFGAIVMTAAGAAFTFRILEGLDPRLPDYAAFDGPHWSLAAGRVANGFFTVLDTIRLAGIVVAVVVTGLHLTVFGMRYLRFANLVRTAGVLALTLSVAYGVLVLGPRMHENLVAYWDAAAAGGDWQTPKAAFDRDHPLSTRLLALEGIVLLGVIIASSVALTTRDDDPDPDRPRDSPLEPPALATRSR